MTASTTAVPHAAHPMPKQNIPLDDLVDHALLTVPRGPTTVTDALVLDREDAGTRLSSSLGRRIVHRSSPSEHLFVDVRTGRAVRLVVDRSDSAHPVAYMAQSPSPGTERDLYRQLADATKPGTTAADGPEGPRSRA
ncbi:hypothetical protein [Amycolatopsis keratiniphila]|uniref:hypothetical protein n=1 Tax=Amycolatopsis keratiniphila TaxID=129921 RepID=UPI00087BBAE0|nr:hypothetical protein [Amycolatopsis keratiniphila]SDU67241.1 hypothetical protein SAMN04489733_8089 [Amycolatopsis keratiniphila]